MFIREGYGVEDVDLRGFVSLMDLYENNFIRLKKLVPELHKQSGRAVSRVQGCLDVHLQVLERSRYTTTLHMTYHFHERDKTVCEPDLKLRVYHDAGLVEVISGHLRHGRQRLDTLPADALRAKWKLNRLLYKWLGFCLHLGHRFSAVQAIKPVYTSRP